MYDTVLPQERRQGSGLGAGEGRVKEGAVAGGKEEAAASSSGKLCFNVCKFWECSQASGLP